VDFYRHTRPSRRGWGPIAKLAPEVKPDSPGWVTMGHWICGCATVYLTLFGIGEMLLGSVVRGALWLALALVCGATLVRSLHGVRNGTLADGS
jgi:hypothetical protein